MDDTHKAVELAVRLRDLHLWVNSEPSRSFRIKFRDGRWEAVLNASRFVPIEVVVMQHIPPNPTQELCEVLEHLLNALRC